MQKAFRRETGRLFKLSRGGDQMKVALNNFSDHLKRSKL